MREQRSVAGLEQKMRMVGNQNVERGGSRRHGGGSAPTNRDTRCNPRHHERVWHAGCRGQSHERAPSELNARFASHAAEHTRKPATSSIVSMPETHFSLRRSRAAARENNDRRWIRLPRVSRRPRALRAPAQPETALALLPTNQLATLTRSVHLRVNPHNGPADRRRPRNNDCLWLGQKAWGHCLTLRLGQNNFPYALGSIFLRRQRSQRLKQHKAKQRPHVFSRWLHHPEPDDQDVKR